MARRVCRIFFNDTATTEIYTLSLHDALPISQTQMQTQTQMLIQMQTQMQMQTQTQMLTQMQTQIGRAHV